MVFKRDWDSTCPKLWDKWETEGIIWTIEDLPPEDDEHAVKLLLEQFCPDETLCSTLDDVKSCVCHTGAQLISSWALRLESPQDSILTSLRLHEDTDSLQKIANFWRECISRRMSLACYKTVGNDKSLAALNVCIVKCIDDKEPESEQTEPGKFSELLKTIEYLESKLNVFEYLAVDKFLYGLGLLVTRENRGFKLGAKVLAARKPMCHKMCLTATSTLFTGTASQKLAEKCGYTTDVVVTLDELARNGMAYPIGDERYVKIMSKKYD